MKFFSGRWPFAVGLLVSVLIFQIGSADDAVDFNRDIRPILSENCFHCHGQDSKTREADLRLDEEAGSREAITPGSPEKSEAWLRVVHSDKDELMPPPKSNRRLSARQKSLLKKWIESGAKYDSHWAYKKPIREKIDSNVIPDGGNEVDFFVAKQQAKRKLVFSEQADKGKLLRRVSLDLIGLPPSPEDLRAFQADNSADAFAKVVDRLLASPRFGEKWARGWLDLARYADSNGFQADQLRDSWAFRDWVINALNANMPFDQFSIEQLAGDLLPNATLDQKIATGFHRTPTCNVEAGVHPEENRTNQVVDRVNTTGTVWLGTTMECAQCHDHKYDPFTMQDYYGIFSYFNNTPVEVRNPSGKGVSFDFYGPKMELPLAKEKEIERKELTAQVDEVNKKRKKFAANLDKDFDLWLASAGKKAERAPRWKTLAISDFSGTGGESIARQKDGSALVTGTVPDVSTYQVSVELPGGPVRALRLEMLADDSLPARGPARGNGSRPNVILSEIAVKNAEGKEIQLLSASADFSQGNWEVAQAIDGDLKKGWAIAPEFGKDHWAVFETAPQKTKPGEKWTVELVQNYGNERVMGRFRLSASEFAPELDDLPADIAKILTKTPAKISKKENKKLRDHFEKNAPEIKAIDKELVVLNRKLKAVTPDTTLVMVEMEEPRETHVMRRGNYLDLAEKVSATTPASLHSANEKLPPNRLGFAKWLMAPENPLVARVTVNRWWAEIFGTGIVRTLEDFGTQSEPPTHPGLLDWLAVEFVESGWDMKHILKKMVTSRAYQQDSRIGNAAFAEADPENRFLWRGPRFRLSAETIRDNALAVSGLLSTKMGGKPIMPYQPPGMWRQVGRNEPKWVDARTEDRFRRGVYIVWRRAAPYPSFVNFDAPDRSSCVVSRPRTNTPLQALTLLNDPAYTEMALALANHVLTEKKGGKLSDQISYLFERVLSRKPTVAELDHMTYLVEQKMETFSEESTQAVNW